MLIVACMEPVIVCVKFVNEVWILKVNDANKVLDNSTAVLRLNGCSEWMNLWGEFALYE